jgi:hypothetical protein
MNERIKELAEQARKYADENRSGSFVKYDPKWFVLYNEKFAALVVANIDPKSFMSWQEGYAAGVAQEREECAELMFRLDLCGEEGKAAEAILARGTT